MVIPPRVTVVVITRDRREGAIRTVERLRSLPERPPVIVVDDASSDDTASAIRERFRDVRVIERRENAGAAARTDGVRRAMTPYVAFADDDSWWAPGALRRAARAMDRNPRIALVAARLVVEPGGHDDPVSEEMADSPLRDERLPGPEVLGFVACGAVVRRDAYLAVGGFQPRMHVGGEEELLALDLRRRGWRSVYLHDVVAHHEPHPGERPGRERRVVRNALWTAWLRRRPLSAARLTLGAARDLAIADVRHGVVEAARDLPSVLREREALPRDVERDRRRIERASRR